MFYIIGIVFILFFGKYRYTIGHNAFATKIGKIVVNVIILSIGVFIFYRSVMSPDASSYEETFINSIEFFENGIRKKLSYALMVIVNRFTDNYQIYRMVVGMVFFLPYAVIIRMDRVRRINWVRFLTLLCIYPLLCSAINLNATLSTSVCVLAFYYFIKGEKRVKNFFLTILMLLVGVMFHDTAVFYCLIFIVYLVVRRMHNNKITMSFLLFLGFLGIAAMRLEDHFLRFVMKYAGNNNRQFLYVESLHKAGMGFMVCVFIHILAVLVICRFVARMRTSCPMKMDMELEYFAIASYVLLPFYALNFLFMRIFRGVIYILYVAFADRRMNSRRNMDLIAGIAIVEILLFVFEEAMFVGEILG